MRARDQVRVDHTDLPYSRIPCTHGYYLGRMMRFKPCSNHPTDKLVCASGYVDGISDSLSSERQNTHDWVAQLLTTDGCASRDLGSQYEPLKWTHYQRYCEDHNRK